MAASILFENIIHQVKSSNLNFRIEMAPFSANIVIKKSLIKDSLGFYLQPELPFKEQNHAEIADELLTARVKHEKIKTEYQALEVSYNCVINGLKDVLTENKSYQKIITNLQKTCENNIEAKKDNHVEPIAELQVEKEQSKKKILNGIKSCDNIVVESDTIGSTFL